jgi:hypothetical protein
MQELGSQHASVKLAIATLYNTIGERIERIDTPNDIIAIGKLISKSKNMESEFSTVFENAIISTHSISPLLPSVALKLVESLANYKFGN